MLVSRLIWSPKQVTRRSCLVFPTPLHHTLRSSRLYFYPAYGHCHSPLVDGFPTPNVNGCLYCLSYGQPFTRAVLAYATITSSATYNHIWLLLPIMSLQTFVLENDEWVSRTISADELMRDNGSTRKAGRPPPSKPPTCGVLTRTIVDSPVIRWVLPVQLRSARYNDVALISVRTSPFFLHPFSYTL